LGDILKEKGKTKPRIVGKAASIKTPLNQKQRKKELTKSITRKASATRQVAIQKMRGIQSTNNKLPPNQRLTNTNRFAVPPRNKNGGSTGIIQWKRQQQQRQQNRQKKNAN